MKKVYVDAGHGGSDCGAAYKKRHEADDVLRLALRVAELFELNGVEPILSRKTDADKLINDRTAEANKAKCDYFLCLHRNAFKPNSASGAEVWIWSKSQAGGVEYKFANAIQAELVKVGFANRGVKKGAPDFTDYGVNRQSTMPSCLCEIGFIDSDKDNKIFDGKFEEIASGIASAVCSVLGVPFSAQLYRVRKTWKDEASQIGAYRKLSNAIEECKIGYAVYNNSGKELFRRGDVNGDGKVTAKDAREVLRASAGLEKVAAEQKKAADVDGDGKVTAKDARTILRESAGLE